MATADLPITGMTCASCANRIEVNYATEKATVDYDDATVAPEQLIAAVESAGYQAVLPSTDRADAGEAETDENLRVLVFDSANPDYYIAHYDLLRSDEAMAISSRPTR